MPPTQITHLLLVNMKYGKKFPNKKNIDSQMLVPKKWWFTAVESKKNTHPTKEIPNAGERMLKILKNAMVASLKKQQQLNKSKQPFRLTLALASRKTSSSQQNSQGFWSLSRRFVCGQCVDRMFLLPIFFLGENKKGPFVVADKPHFEIK